MVKTEERNEKTRNLDRMSADEIVGVMAEENYNVCRAIDRARPQIAQAIDLIAPKMQKGGRLIYIGAGTSGRLGVLDASECPPTFGVGPDVVVGIIAGGDGALRTAVEGAEDSAETARNDLAGVALSPLDSVVAISASGNAGYLIGGLEWAKKTGCATVGLTCNPDGRMLPLCDVSIVTDTGAEVLTGSTRLKAGSAHKAVLNMLSTALMVKCGYVYENLMINLKPTNIKLRDRMIRITAELGEVSRERAEEALESAGWNIRRAVDRIKVQHND